MNSIEACKIKLEQEFSVSFEEKGRFYKGVYYQKKADERRREQLQDRKDQIINVLNKAKKEAAEQ
jgi:hypothetical protein